MTQTSQSRRYPSFFFIMGFIGLFAVLTGFATTFILPVAEGSFHAPGVVYLHGAFAFSWILLYLIQTTLIYVKKIRIHKTLGILGIAIAAGIAVTVLPVGLYQVERELKSGLGDTAISGILGTCTSAVMFLTLVIAGLYNRKKPEVHKRLLLLATIVLLWPAWFRFRHYFPAIPRPDIWFSVVLADCFIILAILRDKLVRGKVHPILAIVGLLIILEHVLEILLFDSQPWKQISHIVYRLLSGLFGHFI